MNTIQHSIDTSVSMNLFKNREESSYAHIFKSKLVMFPLSKIKKLQNFDPIRLKKSATEAYPSCDRPRGKKDIDSIKYHVKLLHQNKEIDPIWIITKNNKYILLDGCHRIVASYIENKKYIKAYIIKYS
jgi:hypothetical protein